MSVPQWYSLKYDYNTSVNIKHFGFNGERERERELDFLPAKQKTLVNKAPAQETKFGEPLCFSSKPRCIIPAE